MWCTPRIWHIGCESGGLGGLLRGEDGEDGEHGLQFWPSEGL